MPRSGSGKQPTGHPSDLRVFASARRERETSSGAVARVVGRTSEQEVHHVLDAGRGWNAPQKVEPLLLLPRDGCCASHKLELISCPALSTDTVCV